METYAHSCTNVDVVYVHGVVESEHITRRASTCEIWFMGALCDGVWCNVDRCADGDGGGIHLEKSHMHIEQKVQQLFNRTYLIFATHVAKNRMHI